jgi:hypothetical protein
MWLQLFVGHSQKVPELHLHHMPMYGLYGHNSVHSLLGTGM